MFICRRKEGSAPCSAQNTAMIQSSNTLLCHYVCISVCPIPSATALPRPQSLSLCCLIHSHCSVHTHRHTYQTRLLVFLCASHSQTHRRSAISPSRTYTQPAIRTPLRAHCKHYRREDWQHSVLQQLTVSCR